MMFKTEKTLIYLAAAFGLAGIILVAILYSMMYFMRDTEAMRQALEASGQTIKSNYFTTTYYITTIISVIIVIALFIIPNRINHRNARTMGIMLIILGIVSFWFLWFVPNILMIIAGIMVLRNKGSKEEDEDPVGYYRA